MDVHCPYCETNVAVDADAEHAHCGECERDFAVGGRETVQCPDCGSLLGVPPGASVLICGTCRHRVVLPRAPDTDITPVTGDLRSATDVATEDETSFMASVPDYEEARLEAVRKEFAAQYEVLEPLGRGGMGAVFKARQRQPERLVVLKLLLNGRFASERYRVRFEREAQAVARLKHPGVVSVYEFGEVNGQPYFTMEYVEGCDVKEYVLRHELDKRDICRLMLKICRAVAYAHQRGVIHRDIKPSNILVDGSGNPQLLDFGLARLAGDYSEDRLHMTEAGEVMGTPSYMSPEQTLGRPEEIDIRSDVYSIGVLFYELVTDTLPYRVDRSRPLDALRTVRDFVPVRPSQINPKIDSDLDSVVMKCLEKERDMRYQSAVELAEDIGRYLRGQPVEARPSTSFYHLRKLMWRHRSVFLPIGIALLVVLVVTAGVIAYLAHGREEAEQVASDALEDKQELVEFLLSLEAVRSGVDNLMAQGRWEEAHRAAAFAENNLPEEAGLAGYTDTVRRRIAEATSSEADRVERLIDQLRFRDARERIRHLRQLAEKVGLPELATEMDSAAEQFDEDCWASALSYMQRNGGAVRVLEKFLRECPNSARVTEARYILRSKLKGIQHSEWPFGPEEARQRQEETARVLDVPAERRWQLDGDAALQLVLVPAGEFVMGAPRQAEGFNEDQKPPHRVRIPGPFYMTATEVTREQFEAVTGRTPPAPETVEEGVDPGDLPAAASWKNASLFCTELARKRQLTVRLPTEAEWEYACRAGSENVYGRAGSPTALLERAWCRENSGQRPHPVGQRTPNAWGLYDMHGNMLEWCQDWYDSRYYLASPVDDPRGPENGTYKVLRGGSWSDASHELHAAARRAVPPDSEGPMYGFRVCVEVFAEQPQPPAARAVLPEAPP